MRRPHQQVLLLHVLLVAAVSKRRLLLCIQHALRLLALNAHDASLPKQLH